MEKVKEGYLFGEMGLEIARGNMRVVKARQAVAEAQAALEKALKEAPKWVIRATCSCGGAHQHGSWCYTWAVQAAPPEEGEKTYYSEEAAEEAAMTRNNKAEAAWQAFLAC